MRVIAGEKRSFGLLTPKGMTTRPTTDRIKETLFNMIRESVVGANFLDLYAGSGQIGIEALSRGAKSATFVDNGRDCISCIEQNLTHTGYDSSDRSRVVSSDVVRAINSFKSRDKYDIIFMDPPYNSDSIMDVVLEIKRCDILSAEGFIIVESGLDTDFEELETVGFEILKIKTYKTNKHTFIAY